MDRNTIDQTSERALTIDELDTVAGGSIASVVAGVVSAVIKVITMTSTETYCGKTGCVDF